MTTSVTFDGVTLTGSGSVVNFSGGIETVLDIPSSTINSDSRVGAISINSSGNSVSMSASYTILTGGRTEFLLIKAKQTVIGQLELIGLSGTTTIQNVKLLKVSKASPLGGGALRCSLLFELTKV